LDLLPGAKHDIGSAVAERQLAGDIVGAEKSGGIHDSEIFGFAHGRKKELEWLFFRSPERRKPRVACGDRGSFRAFSS
jgi:hypothetical protein